MQGNLNNPAAAGENTLSSDFSELKAAEEFRSDARDAGFTEIPDIVPNGPLVRFKRAGEKGSSKDCWVVMHVVDGVAWGGYGDWGGAVVGWTSKGSRPQNQAERDAMDARIKAVREQQQAMQEIEYAAAADLAAKELVRWPAANDSHPYVMRKKVKAHGNLRIGNLERTDPVTGEVTVIYKDALMVPIMRKVSGKDTLCSIEYIPAEPGKNKLGFKGGQKAGGYHVIGTPKTIDGRKVFLIAEGYSTGASLFEATGHCVVIAFTAGNLPAIAKQIRESQRDAVIALCADDDFTNEINIGVHKAHEAARAVAGHVVVPAFRERAGKDTNDWNDLAVHEGVDVVRAQIDAAIGSAVKAGKFVEIVQDPAAMAKALYNQAKDLIGACRTAADLIEVAAKIKALGLDAASVGLIEGEYRNKMQVLASVVLSKTEAKKALSPVVEKAAPAEDDEPDEPHMLADGVERGQRCFRVYDTDEDAIAANIQGVEKAGIWMHSVAKGEGGAWVNKDCWIGSPMHVIGCVADENDAGTAVLLKCLSPSGAWTERVMNYSTIADNRAMQSQLMDWGVSVDAEYSIRVRMFLQQARHDGKPLPFIRSTHRTGWHGDASYVLPLHTVGDEQFYLRMDTVSAKAKYGQSGSLEDWQKNVARLCVGNSRLILAVSTAFASLVLHHVGQDSGGVNLVGKSSIGKTGALRVASSVFGSPKHMQRWGSTKNAIENLAFQNNDGLLVLDEMGQVEAREVGDIAYMLANGAGKGRSTATTEMRETKHWRLLFLSSGEVGIAQHMMEAGKKSRAGQEVRLVDVRADAGKNGWGLFEELHEHESSQKFSDAIGAATKNFYGVAAVEFLERLVADGDFLENIAQTFKEYRRVFVEEFVPENPSGQAHRVADRFALIAFGGMLATELGVTGWPAAEAFNAAGACFNGWIAERGAGSQEERRIVEHVRTMLVQHGSSRFQNIRDTNDGKVIYNRLGFVDVDASGKSEFFVLREQFEAEFCLPAGVDEKMAREVLHRHGILRLDGKKQLVSKRLPGLDKPRVFALTYVEDEWSR